MSGRRNCKSLLRTALILLTLGGAADVMALLITPTALNGNEVVPGVAAGANELSFIARFHTLQSLKFDVLMESSDDPFSPIALTGLLENLTVAPWTAMTMTLGGGATLTAIGDAPPTALVTAFSRGTVADFAFDPVFTAQSSGAIGGTVPWFINTHGARLFSINITPTFDPSGASIPEPATSAPVLVALAGLFGSRPETATRQTQRG